MPLLCPHPGGLGRSVIYWTFHILLFHFIDLVLWAALPSPRMRPFTRMRDKKKKTYNIMQIEPHVFEQHPAACTLWLILVRLPNVNKRCNCSPRSFLWKCNFFLHEASLETSILWTALLPIMYYGLLKGLKICGNFQHYYANALAITTSTVNWMLMV